MVKRKTMAAAAKRAIIEVMREMLILAHGGAGGKEPPERALRALKQALAVGWKALKAGSGALEAAVEAVALMEDSGLFNAGRGANLQLDGAARLDASVMDGTALRPGSVIGLEGFASPVRAARVVMELPNTVLTNKGAARVAARAGLERLGPPGARALKRLEKARRGAVAAAEAYDEYFSTVGAVAIDCSASVAAASSTGGVLAMLPGRVGDTPIIGSGIYADDLSGAAACTGRGEDILRLCLAKEVCMRMPSLGAEGASMRSLERMRSMGGQAGLIALDRKGRCAMAHTTPYMAAGVAGARGVRVKGAHKRLA